MTSKRTTRITIERDRVWIIRQYGPFARAWCENCGTEVEVVNVEQAKTLAGATSEDVHSWTRSTNLHVSHVSDKEVRICLHSLMEEMPVLRSLKTGQAS
jgi:hypothetical protein